MRQTLLAPIPVELSREDAAAILENLPLLEGLRLRGLRRRHGAPRELPSDIDAADAAATLEECAAKLRSGRSLEQRRDDLLHTMACKAAIKGGWKSDPAELRALVDRVQSGEGAAARWRSRSRDTSWKSSSSGPEPGGGGENAQGPIVCVAWTPPPAARPNSASCWRSTTAARSSAPTHADLPGHGHRHAAPTPEEMEASPPHDRHRRPRSLERRALFGPPSQWWRTSSPRESCPSWWAAPAPGWRPWSGAGRAPARPEAVREAQEPPPGGAPPGGPRQRRKAPPLG